MGKQFEFQNNSLELNIAGNSFKLDVLDPNLLDAVDIFSKQAAGFNIDSEKSNSENMQKMCEFLLESIDNILGSGSSNKIFESKSKVSFFDLMDVLDFMVTEIKEFKEQKNKKYGNYSPNRLKRK